MFLKIVLGFSLAFGAGQVHQAVTGNVNPVKAGIAHIGEKIADALIFRAKPGQHYDFPVFLLAPQHLGRLAIERPDGGTKIVQDGGPPGVTIERWADGRTYQVFRP